MIKRLLAALFGTILLTTALVASSARSSAESRQGVGVFVGNNPAALQRFENWLGCKSAFVHIFVGEANWSDFRNSASWAIDLWRPFGRALHWSVPLLVSGATLEAAATGDYDAHYRNVARTLSARTTGDSINVRTGWEFNAAWMKWSAVGQPQNFVSAFRRFVHVFRSTDPRFRFEWNVNIGDQGMNPEDGYPGDDAVDVIGMDFYYNTKWYNRDPPAAWEQMVNQPYGLAWHQAFAKQRGKPTAFSEWGVMTSEAADFIDRVADWVEAHDILYHAYWDSDADFPGRLSNDTKPGSGRAYISRFGRNPTLHEGRCR